MKQYHELCNRILNEGVVREDRTGTGTISVFGHQMRFDLQEGFPLLTTKDLGGKRLDAIIYELLWFLSGDTHIGYLVENGVHIWTPDAHRLYREHRKAQGVSDDNILPYDTFKNLISRNECLLNEWGELGRIYGAQWRSWETHDEDGAVIDQIANVIEQIRADPNSRRLIVSAWNVSDLPKMGLPPCHVLFQFYVHDGKLSCQLYQRSGDVFLGVPFNIASYALLTMMVAQVTGLKPGEFVHTLGDAHIYLNHVDQVREQLNREIRALPKMWVHPGIKDIDQFDRHHFYLTEYDPHPAIKGSVSVG